MMKRQVRISLPQVLISSLILLIAAGFATAGTLSVPTRTYPTIQSAIDAAGDGDIVVVAPGTYSGSGNVDLDFGGKAITVRSTIVPENPDWDIIAATIIDCQGNKYNPHRAFYFQSGEGPDSKVLGFTIKNGYARGPRGEDGDVDDDVSIDPDDPNFVRANSGADANAPGDDGYGGAILCEGASPTIKYCVITNSTVTGGQGGDGDEGLKGPWQGTDPNKSPYDDGQWGGYGGKGEGNGYGGAIACIDGSSPIISYCIITDNIARGGVGGDGGQGGEATGSEAAGWDGRESGGGDGGEGKGDGFGGGIYAENGSSPVITNCTFSNNIATEGLGGVAGARGQGNVYADPPSPLDGEPGWSDPSGSIDIAGGAAWYGSNSNSVFTNCTFTGNRAYYDIDPNNIGFIVYTVGGVLYSEADNTITLDTCEFTGNLGGAVYGGTGCDLDVDNSSFQDNSDTARGGAIYIGSGGIVNIQNSTFTNNSAYNDGGALKLRTNATLTNCLFSNNTAGDYGGAIDAYSGSLITVDVDNCNFTGNQATWGGGFSSETFTATFTDSYFINNTAQRGGGLDLTYGDVSITGSVISGNKSTDDNGGGLNILSTDTMIIDCTIKDNSADGAVGHGGAIYFQNTAATQVVKNCLITGNSAAANGGAISCEGASPTISNGTFSENTVVSLSGNGSALYCNSDSDPTVINSIFNSNVEMAIYEKDADSDVTLSYSLFNNNNNGAFYDDGTILTDADLAGINNNRNGDPDFVSGPLGEFYLNQTSSPAVNNGWNTAVYWGLDSYTTDAANVLDSGTVDMGYHYIDVDDAQKFVLTVEQPGYGTVEPIAPEPIDYNSVLGTYTYYVGTTVTLTATPNSGWWVKTWSGTDDDSSTKTTNAVIMSSDKTVTVEFRQTRTLIVAVGGGGGYYSTIQGAIHDANDGDIVVVYPGTYFGPEIQIDKSIEIRSKHPDDPAWVAATIIDRTGYANRAFLFGPNTDTDTILNGFTIQNCRWFVLDGWDARTVGQNGMDGIGAQGGAIYIWPGASPVIKNSIIKNNWIRGGNGGKGYNADLTHNAGRGGWGAWARGGAIYCGTNSSPTFINCQIIDNTARGGNGGNGGNDAQPGGEANYGGNWSRAEWDNIDPRKADVVYPEDWVKGDLWEKWDEMAQNGGTQLDSHYVIDGIHYYGYFGDYRWYSGYGGGVFCNTGSNVTFIDCTISGNLAQGGMSGEGGERPGENPEPEFSYEIPSFGGGVYAAAGSTVTFIGSTITDNISSEPEFSDPNDPNSGLRYRKNPYLGHGGGVAAEDTAMVTFIDSTFSQNEAAIGGGLFFANANPRIIDSDFTSNSAFHGGGLFGEHGPATIIGSNFKDNVAFSDYNPDYTEKVFGEGGGLHLRATEASVIDCNISNNKAEASGGGVYFGGENAPSLINCLITNNTAGRDGGGVSVNIFTQLTISNSTIADNRTTGMSFGDSNSYGGGLYVYYQTTTDIIDSIIWGNYSTNGAQLAIGSDFEYDLGPSTVNISYSDIGPGYDPNEFNKFLGSGSDDTSGDSGQSGGTVLVDGQAIYDQFDAGQATVKVIVSLAEPAQIRAATDWDSPASVDILRAEIANRQSQVLCLFTPVEFTLRHRLENVAAFSGEVTLDGLNKLLAEPLVAHIEPVRYVQPTLAQAIPLANALASRQKYNGTGIAVAIIDTGVDYTHPRLGAGGFPNEKVIGGYDTGENDNDPMPVGEAHGTACAGIAGGDLGTVGDYIGGVAYNAKIYALKASIDYAGFFSNDALLAAWDWCVTHRNDDPNNPIKVMSNSWGMPGLPFNDPAAADAYSPGMTTAAETAVAAGITILAASGNDYFAGDGISWPAAMSNVISVGAVYDTTDKVTDYSNTAEILDILAPADPVYTTDIVGPDGSDSGDYYPYFGGTSSACPFAAGAVAALQSAAFEKTGSYLTPAVVRNMLIATGDPVTDTKVAITKPRINLGAAISGQLPIYVEDGCILNGWDRADASTQDWDPNYTDSNNINSDPYFVDGYYLSQAEAGQEVNSPCVDKGSADAHSLDMYRHTTRTDRVIDDGTVDMGYHYILSTDFVGDFDFDGEVEGNITEDDWVIFQQHWLEEGCSFPDWGHGTDLNQDGRVNFIDFSIFNNAEVGPETTPPSPDPMTWATAPSVSESNSITMIATTAYDNYSGSNVEYKFQRTDVNGIVDYNFPGEGIWGSDAKYIDTSIEPDTQYGYRVKARDARGNETGWSNIGYVTTMVPGTPMAPSNLVATAVSISQIDLSWVDNSNNEDSFSIERKTGSGLFSQIATVGVNVTIYSDTGLTDSTTYAYRVLARNSVGDSAYSNTASATTEAAANTDTTPPVTDAGADDPYKSTFAVTPYEYVGVDGKYYHTMTATTATDDTGPVEYYFYCYSNSAASSDWQESPTYDVLAGNFSHN
ncbi:MAG TPA: hypothetical protein ENH34_01225, partial [Phycisphaerales bacterium]|nr:hypothetical protein [Phycisphaerales bacterium]